MMTSAAEVLQILQGAAQGNPGATQAMMQLETRAEYYTALGQILTEPSIDEQFRQIAALQIKKNLENPACGGNATIQQSMLGAIGDSNPKIRKAMASAIARGITVGVWPLSAVDFLIQKLQTQPTPDTVSGCVRALTYLAEDMIEAFDVTSQSTTLVNLIVPLIVDSDPEVRDNALTSCSVFMEQAGMRTDGGCYAAMKGVVPSVISSCMGLLKSQGLSEGSMVHCVKILVLAMTYNEEIMPHFAELAEMMNYIATTLPDENIRTEAIQFWKAALFFPSATEAAKAYMPSVIPMLLRCMVYSSMELAMAGSKANDWQEPDRPEDIKPRHFQGKSRNFHHDDEDDDGQDGDEDAEWNLRRSAAHTLDEISQMYGDQILTLALEHINAMMQPDKPWAEQEAAILAIGAVCEGCYDGLRPFMAQIIQRLIVVANSDSYHHLARQICLWTMSQMNEFLLEKENAALLDGNIKVILALMMSPTKSVQEGATAALQNIMDTANNSNDNFAALRTGNYMRSVVETCSACLTNYQLKNRQTLLECIESVCGYYNTELTAEDTFGLLMGPLGTLWGQTPDDSPLIFAYFECMASVCTAFGRAIEPYAESIFSRTITMILNHTQLRYAAKSSQNDVDAPDEEYLITALDLLSSLFDAMGSSLAGPLQQQPNLMPCILQSLRDESADIQKAAFALIGDLSGACPSLVQQNLDTVCTLMLARLKDVDERRAGAASNVAWALAELIEHQMDIAGHPTLQPAHYDAFIRAMGSLLAHTTFSTNMVNLAENLCLSIGCILVAEPDVLRRTGAGLGFFASRWCEYVRNIKNVPLKDRALRGFVGAAQADPASLQLALIPFFDVCASVADDASSDMKQALRGLLQTLKTNLPNEFSAAQGKARKETARKLHITFSV